MKKTKINIPEEWEIKTLGELGKTYSGLSGKSKANFGEGKPYIPYMNIFNNIIINENNFELVDIKNGENQNLVKHGDVFFTTSSETPKELGMPSAYLGYEKELYLNSFCFGYRILNDNEVSPLYLVNFFRGGIGRKLIFKQAQGATRYNLSKNNFLKTSILLPPLPEQKKIAKILSTWDNAIETTTKLIHAKQKLKKGLIQKLISNPVNSNNQKTQLGDLLKLTLRITNKPNTNYLALGLRSHGKGVFHKPDSDPKANAMDKLYKVKENDLIVNITFAWEGAIAIVKKKDEGGLVSHRFPTYVFNQKIAIPDYFKYIIVTERFKYFLGLISPGGAGRNRVMSKKDFLKIKWPTPPVKEQKKIASILTTADKEIEHLQNYLAKLQEQKKGLMQQLLTGKKRVNTE